MINFTIIGCVHMVSYHRSPIQVHWMMHVINISLWIKIALLTKLLYRYCIFLLIVLLYEKFIPSITSVDTEMCCPKGKCGCQYFISLTLKKKMFMDTGVLDFFNKKLILDYYFCLKSGPVFLFQIFKFSNFPPPKGYKIVSLIIN